jgi:hypothetical protein
MRIVRISIIAAALSVAGAATAQCVSAQGYGVGSASTIGVVAADGWTGRDAPPIAEAIAMWQGACDGIAGSDLPVLTEGTNADIVIGVAFMPGEQNPVAGGGCAFFDHDLNSSYQIVGGTIRIYPTDSNGQSCSAYVTAAAWLDGLIAHELGHVLGLANSPCSGYVMGPNPYADDPTSAECAGADDCWTTEEEATANACALSCPVACTGVPPTCPTTNGGGGEGPYCGSTGCHTPLILDLDGDGIATTTLENGVLFDMSGDSNEDRTAWTARDSGDALLYIDENRNGIIDGAKELFGDATLLPNGERARHGFEALARFDLNGDGLISPRDEAWGKLRLWIDRSHDGVMTTDENYSLGQAGVVDLSLSYVRKGPAEDFGRDESGNFHLLQGTFRQRSPAGAPNAILTRAMSDILFAVEVTRNP